MSTRRRCPLRKGQLEGSATTATPPALAENQNELCPCYGLTWEKVLRMHRDAPDSEGCARSPEGMGRALFRPRPSAPPLVDTFLPHAPAGHGGSDPESWDIWLSELPHVVE